MIKMYHTWRAWTTVEGAHGVQALHHGSAGAATIIGQTFIHILTAIAIALPTWDILEAITIKQWWFTKPQYELYFFVSCMHTKTNTKVQI